MKLSFLMSHHRKNTVRDKVIGKKWVYLERNTLHRVSVQFSSVQSLSRVQLFATPWTAAGQASLSITNSWSLLKLMSVESVMPSNHLILCHPLLLLPSIFPSIKLFSNESTLHIRWPEYWSFSFPPGSSVHGILQAKILEWVAMLSSPGIKTTSPSLWADSLPFSQH